MIKLHDTISRNKRFTRFLCYLLFFLCASTLSFSCKNIFKRNDSVSENGLNNISEKTRYYMLLNKTDALYREGKADSMLLTSQELLKSADLLKEDSLLMAAYKMLGNHSRLISDYVSAIEYYINGLHIAEEKRKYLGLQVAFYNNIGDNYNQMRDHVIALAYLKKADSVIAGTSIVLKNAVYIYDNIAETYLFLKQPQAAFPYLNRAMEANLSVKNAYIQSPILYDYGDYHVATGDMEFAGTFYKRAIILSDSMNDSKHLSIASHKYAQWLFRRNDYNNSKKNALISLSLAKQNKYREEIILNAELLSQLHKLKQNNDSAFFYIELAVSTKDSIFSAQNSNRLRILTLNEHMREAEKQTAKTKATAERKETISYIFLAIGIIVASILFILAGKTVIFTEKQLRVAGVAIILMAVEFINFFCHPLLGRLTYHSIPLMFLILIIVAYALGLLHHMLDKKLDNVIERNNKVKEKFVNDFLKEREKRNEKSSGE
jgi:tetratricopeptide (TPR) repeat protein